MKNLDKNFVYQRLVKQAFNSSHYVWLWSDLTFIESKNGWIFAFTQKLGVHLIALEPLPPELVENLDVSFAEAFLELKNYLEHGTIAFVAIYTPFAKLLANQNFKSLQIGKEPWANLSDIKPTGHAGRKIRVAVNQSTKAGLRVEEWKLVDVIKNSKQLLELNQLKKRWEEQSFIALSGFLHGMTFESIPEDRRCFVALDSTQTVEGILITTPIEKGVSWYFEDTIIKMSSNSNRGVAELLTIQAMEALRNDGFKEVSLGIVPMTSVGLSEFDFGPPKTFLKLVNGIQATMGLFYNASGLELFRRRFKLDRWNKIYLSVCIDNKFKNRQTIEWFKVILAIGLAYEPKLQFKASYIIHQIKTPFKRYSVTFLFIFLSTLFFLFFNFNTEIPPALFSTDSPLLLWPLETFSSSFYYFTSNSFLIMLAALSGTVYYIEKEVYDRKWVVYAILLALLNDSIIRTLCGFSSHYFSNPIDPFSLINLFPHSGGSILLATLLGFSTVLIGQKKDKLFAYGFFTYLLASIFSAFIQTSTFNVLLHTLFYVEGYFLGKLYTFFQSQKDQLASKNQKIIDAQT